MKYLANLKIIENAESIADCCKNLRLLIIALEIIDILERGVFCFTRADMKKKVSGSYKNKVRVLEDLTTLGILYRHGNGWRGNPYLYLNKEILDRAEENLFPQIEN